MLVHDFFNNEFKAFSQYDNVRSIPSIVDGLKDSQRKAIFGMTINGNKEIKVSQLAELTSMKTHYDHGGASLEGTIIGLAQNYAGSNNVNMFEPIGQFGSILGSESGAPRYIFTKPSKIMRKVFREDDECILRHHKIDGETTEPFLYYPTIPLWAVNGSNGIGTGYRSLILPRSLDGIKKAVAAISKGKKVKAEWLIPFYNKWTGKISDEGTRWRLSGSFERGNTSSFVITEIPAGMGIDKVKENLISLMDSGDIKDFTNYSSEYGIKIEVTSTRKFLSQTDEEILKQLKLIAYVTEQLTFWDENNNIVVYDTFEEALRSFVKLKLETVETRRLKQIEVKEQNKEYFLQLILFINLWHKIKSVNKMTTEEIKNHMLSKGILNEYIDRLMNIKISSLSSDAVDKHNKTIDLLDDEINFIKGSNSTSIYLTDLADL